MTRPTDLPEIRQAMLDFLATGEGREQMIRVNSDHGFLIYDVATRDQAETIYTAEVARWRTAELFFVTPQMADLARAAAASLPDYSLHIEDLPAPAGCIYFDSPLGQTPTREGHTLPIVACIWGPMTGPPPHHQAGVWLSWYTQARDAHQQARTIFSGDTERLAVADAYYSRQGPWCYDGETAMFYGQGQRHPGRLAEWMDLVRCSWLLMQQTIVTVTDHTADRATRRRLARRGVITPPVRVISLRRSDGHGDRHGDRDYLHQWVVRGHWRRQWYPTQNRHVPIWISPHIKGPEGAPLLGGEKVQAWRR